jgi:FkbM family methyltransferase
MAISDKLMWRARMLRNASGGNWMDALAESKPYRVEQWGWKLRFLKEKLAGSFPEASWGQIAAWLGEQDLRYSGSLAALAQEIEEDRDAGITRFRTPQGDFWGRPQDGEELGGLAFEHLVLRMYERGGTELKRGDIVIDGGGHLGTFTRLALMRGARRVIAFEPDELNRQCLERTLPAELSAGQVTIVPAALWREPGTVEFEAQGGGPSGHISETAGNSATIRIPAKSIDQIHDELNLERIDFIKMDIEGAERHALKGGEKTIARDKPRMAICTYHLPDDVAVIRKTVLDVRPDYRVRMRQGQQAYFF